MDFLLLAGSVFILITLMWSCQKLGFPGGSDGKETAYNVRDLGLIPGSGKTPREGNGYPLLPGGSDGKASVYNVGDLGSIPGLGRSLGEGHGNPLQYYCLENPMDRGAW